MIKLYGIPNCDTVKKARSFLEKKKIDFEFVDFKKTSPTQADLERWKQAFGDWPLNKKGPTFRSNQEEFEKLPAAKIAGFVSTHSSMIKRPILEKNGQVLLFGFSEEDYKKVFKL